MAEVFDKERAASLIKEARRLAADLKVEVKEIETQMGSTPGPPTQAISVGLLALYPEMARCILLRSPNRQRFARQYRGKTLTVL